MIENQDGRKLAIALRNRILATVFLVIVCCCTLVAAAKSSYTVDVVADGKTITVTTSEHSADVILQQAGITLGDKDKLNTDDFVIGGEAQNGNKIIVLRAMPITIVDDGVEVAAITVAGTVADALEEAEVSCRPVDKLNYELTTLLGKDMVIEIQRAFSVDVTADGETQTVDFLEGTVSDILNELGITLDDDDEVSPAINAEIKPGDAIKVFRVSYEERTATETIKFKTVTKESSTLYKGTTKVEQEGKNGKKTVIYKDKIVDGKVEKSTVISQEIITKAVNKVVLKGTKIKVLSTSGPISTLALPSTYTLSDGIPTNAIATFTGKATAYTAPAGSGTASGAKVRSGYVAVDPNKIPYGTQMYIVSTDGKYVYGYCIAADTGGFVKRGNVVADVFMDTMGECYQWGSRQVCVYILKWGNGTV